MHSAVNDHLANPTAGAVAAAAVLLAPNRATPVWEWTGDILPPGVALHADALPWLCVVWGGTSGVCLELGILRKVQPWLALASPGQLCWRRGIRQQDFWRVAADGCTSPDSCIESKGVAMAPRDVEAQEPLLNGEDAEACPSSRSWLLFWYYNKHRQSGGGEPGVPC